MNRSSIYRWLAVFREEEPGRFGGKNSETSGWVKVTRQGIAAAKAIVPAASAAGPGDPAYLDFLMPWSESVPAEIRLKPEAAEEAARWPTTR